MHDHRKKIFSQFSDVQKLQNTNQSTLNSGQIIPCFYIFLKSKNPYMVGTDYVITNQYISPTSLPTRISEAEIKVKTVIWYKFLIPVIYNK